MSGPFDDPISYVDRDILVEEYRRLQDKYSKAVFDLQEAQKVSKEAQRVAQEYREANASFAHTQEQWMQRIEEWRIYTGTLKARISELERNAQRNTPPPPPSSPTPVKVVVEDVGYEDD